MEPVEIGAVRQLMLDEIAKLKRGEFSDDLLPSVVNNMKRDFYKQLESNQFRANAYVDAFINRQDWEQAVGQIDRISKMTKAEIVAFANKYLNDNYVCVYKEQVCIFSSPICKFQPFSVLLLLPKVTLKHF